MQEEGCRDGTQRKTQRVGAECKMKRIVQDCPLPTTQHTLHPSNLGDNARDDPTQQSDRRSDATSGRSP